MGYNHIEHLDDDDWKIAGLAIIQSTGIFVAFLIHVVSYWFSRFDLRAFWFIFAVLFICFIYSVTIALRSPPARLLFTKMTSALVRRDVSPRLAKTEAGSLAKLVRYFAWIDFAVVGICIANTGGSEKSVFAPFLFIIVPMAVIVNVSHWREILAFTLVAIGIFLVGQCPLLCLTIFPWAAQFQAAGNVSHAILFAVSTTVCTIFPVFFNVIERLYPEMDVRSLPTLS